jgi:hypothetical protein
VSDTFTGRCACGSVTYEFHHAPDFVANCYCRDCQKSSGAVMATYFSVQEDDFTLLSGSPSSYRYVAESGNTLARKFCPTCGDRLFTDELSGFPRQVFVRLASMDEPERIKQPVIEIFTRNRPSWVTALDVPQYWTRPGAAPDASRDRLSAGCG